MPGRKPTDLMDRTFGRLHVRRPVGKATSGAYIWECICDCGNYKNVRMNNLLDGNTLSCGCHKREVAIRNRAIGRYKKHMKSMRVRGGADHCHV